MGQIDVGTPGFAIDITAAEFKFNGDTLSAAIESMELNIKQEEEVVHFQGLQEPQERTAGQRTYDASVTMGTRQFFLFVAAVADGDFDAFNNQEFELTLHGRPRNDDKIYEWQLHKFRFLDHGFNLDKSASKNKIRCSFLSYEQTTVTEA